MMGHFHQASNFASTSKRSELIPKNITAAGETSRCFCYTTIHSRFIQSSVHNRIPPREPNAFDTYLIIVCAMALTTATNAAALAAIHDDDDDDGMEHTLRSRVISSPSIALV